MPTFDDASEVEQACWNLKQADYPRGSNRARINELFNGFPPFTKQEEEENGIEVNVNFLQSCRLAHDARSQFYNAILKPGNFFTARTDMGPAHKRSEWGAIVTREWNRPMKKSLLYYEKQRGVFASDVLHGIGPGIWAKRDGWCPEALGVEDVLIPGNTKLPLRDLTLFALYRSLSGPELIALTRGPNVDPGWNRELVDKCLEWIDREAVRLMGTNWPEIWAPEKMSERVKSDGGFYVGDQIPKIDCFDFYFYDGDSENPGWRRRIILDSWAITETSSSVYAPRRKEGDVYRNDGQFLFNGRARKYASHYGEIVSFQFADLSAVSPFSYHSIRSLGFLLWALCNLQNRMHCRLNEAVFEALMMYFRVKNMDDAQRALKLDLINRGIIEEGINPVPAQERYQVNAPLVQFGIQTIENLIALNSSSYVQQPNYSQGGVEKTKFQVMAETNAMTSLVSAALTQAYFYQAIEYQEIVRRFCLPNSEDHDIKAARAACLRQGVPEEMLQADYWDIEPERVMGAGNKTLEMTISQQLMEWLDRFDPEPQREILRDSVLAITDDAARANRLVPREPVKVTDAVHDAQISAGVLLQGLPVAIKTGMNHIEYIETMLVSLAVAMSKATQRGNMATMDELIGFQNLAGHIREHIKILANDPNEQERVKRYMDQVTKLENEMRGFAQRLQKAIQAQAQGNGGGGMDAKDRAKVEATRAAAQAKIQNMRESHANRTAQRQVQFEMEEQRKQQDHALEMRRKAAEIQADTEAKDIQTAAEIRRNRLRSMESE